MSLYKTGRRRRSYHRPDDAVPTPESVNDSIRARIDLCEQQLAALADRDVSHDKRAQLTAIYQEVLRVAHEGLVKMP